MTVDTRTIRTLDRSALLASAPPAWIYVAVYFSERSLCLGPLMEAFLAVLRSHNLSVKQTYFKARGLSRETAPRIKKLTSLAAAQPSDQIRRLVLFSARSDFDKNAHSTFCLGADCFDGSLACVFFAIPLTDQNSKTEMIANIVSAASQVGNIIYGFGTALPIFLEPISFGIGFARITPEMRFYRPGHHLAGHPNGDNKWRMVRHYDGFNNAQSDIRQGRKLRDVYELNVLTPAHFHNQHIGGVLDELRQKYGETAEHSSGQVLWYLNFKEIEEVRKILLGQHLLSCPE